MTYRRYLENRWCEEQDEATAWDVMTERYSGDPAMDPAILNDIDAIEDELTEDEFELEAQQNSICLRTLIAGGRLPADASEEDARKLWEQDYEEYCPNCPLYETCPLVQYYE